METAKKGRGLTTREPVLQGQLWASVKYIKRESIVHGYIAWRVFVW